MIKLEVIGAQRLPVVLRGKVEQARAAAKSTLDAWAVELASYIRANKLSGDPLHRRSGLLSSSIRPYQNSDGDVIEGGAGGGRGVPYAQIHEFGGVIHHPGGTAYFVPTSGSAVFVSNASALADSLPRTKPHEIPMPERSYMRSSFNEEAPSGMDKLRAAIKAAIAA